MRLSSLAGLMLLLAGLAQAQNPTPFDCQFSGTLTAASPTSAAYFNKGPTAPCVSFRVTYYTTNASGVSLSLQGTGSLPNGNPDTAHWTNLTAQTGSSNPAIGTVSGSISAAYDYYPWIQLTAGTLTGTNATLTYTTLAYKGDSAKLNGGGSITGGPFTSGDVVTGAGGQAIQDSGTLLSSLIVNPMTAVGDMIAGGTSPAGVPTRVPPNVSLVPRVLTQSGDGTNAGQPTWSVIASGLIYYATDTASDIATDLQYTSATFSPKTTLGPYALSVGTTNLQTWATNSGAPGASFIPAGIYVAHLHYSRSPAPIGTIQLQAVINEVSSTGVFIANIGTTELSPVINPQGGEQEDDLAYADSNTYTFASTSSRVSVIVQAVSTSATPTVSLYVGGTADAHIELPSPGGGGSGSTTVNGASCALNGSCNANWVSGSIINLHVAQFTGTSGEIQDGGVLGSAASHAATDFQAAGSYVAGASALTTQYNIPIVSGTPGTLMQGGLFNPSGGVLAPMAADSTTAIQLCRHNGTTCDVTYDSTNGRVGIGTTSPSQMLTVGNNNQFTVTFNGQVTAQNPAAVNDSDFQIASFGGGTDATLGNINMTIKVHPSATGANRYVSLTAGDSAAYRPIVLQPTSGNVGIGTTSPVYGLDAARSGASGTARFWDQTATTGSTLVTITPGAAQTSASKVFSVGGVVEMLASTFLLNGHTCSIVSTVVTCP